MARGRRLSPISSSGVEDPGPNFLVGRALQKLSAAPVEFCAVGIVSRLVCHRKIGRMLFSWRPKERTTPSRELFCGLRVGVLSLRG
jgi:hypothetical protein